MAKTDFDVILFDLGGVLIDLVGIPRMVEWTRGRFTVEQLWEKWLLSEAGRQFESGRIPLEQFAAMMVEEFGLPITPDEFGKSFYYWITGPFPGVKELLGQLAQSHRLASLSNTNEMHWRRMREEMGLVQCFHRSFPSHETGFVKPDREAFEHVIRELGCAPARILYFDDSPLNVRAARALGISGHRTAGIGDVTRILGELGLI